MRGDEMENQRIRSRNEMKSCNETPLKTFIGHQKGAFWMIFEQHLDLQNNHAREIIWEDSQHNSTIANKYKLNENSFYFLANTLEIASNYHHHIYTSSRSLFSWIYDSYLNDVKVRNLGLKKWIIEWIYFSLTKK
jgi:hypothetical protein